MGGGASKNNGTPKSSILIGFSIINMYKPSILGGFPLFLEIFHVYIYECVLLAWFRRGSEDADGVAGGATCPMQKYDDEA